MNDDRRVHIYGVWWRVIIMWEIVKTQHIYATQYVCYACISNSEKSVLSKLASLYEIYIIWSGCIYFFVSDARIYANQQKRNIELGNHSISNRINKKLFTYSASHVYIERVQLINILRELV